MHRFRYDELADCREGDLVHLNKEESGHLFKTLRASEGEEYFLMDGKGLGAMAKVAGGKSLEIMQLIKAPEHKGVRLHLYIASPKRLKMDQVLRQCAELGVWRIVPVLCDYSVAKPDADSIDGRWTDILFEGCKQSGNPYLPVPERPLSLKEAVADAVKRCERSFFGSVRETAKKESAGEVKDAAWFVGPEGGFSEQEENFLIENGVEGLHFGNYILRVETAALCGIILLQERFSGQNLRRNS